PCPKPAADRDARAGLLGAEEPGPRTDERDDAVSARCDALLAYRPRARLVGRDPGPSPRRRWPRPRARPARRRPLRREPGRLRGERAIAPGRCSRISAGRAVVCVAWGLALRRRSRSSTKRAP